MENFKSLDVAPFILEALDHLGFETPTPIQAQSIPLALEGADVIGCAQTGTGKTAAYGIPMLDHLAKHPQDRALILAPTRELAKQIREFLQKLCQSEKKMRSALLIGGESMREQIRLLRSFPKIIVATPGRLVDHMESGTIQLDRVKYLVLDEADRMLDMGFAEHLDQIVDGISKERRTLLFSATLPKQIEKLALRYQKDPVRVTIGTESSAAENVTQKVIRTTTREKRDLLHKELVERMGSIIVFVKTKRRVDEIRDYLHELGHSVTHIHGDRSQHQRNRAISGMRAKQFRILVATDVAARGLDLPTLQHVINFDLPQFPEEYIHRIGRTGRAQATGEAVSFVTPEERKYWRRIETDLNAGDVTFEGAHPERQRDRAGRNERKARGDHRNDRNDRKDRRPPRNRGKKSPFATAASSDAEEPRRKKPGAGFKRRKKMARKPSRDPKVSFPNAR